MKYRVHTVSFDIDPVDLTEEEVSILQRHLSAETLDFTWEADNDEKLIEVIESAFGYNLSSIIFSQL